MFPFEIVPAVHVKPVLTVPARVGMIERMVHYDKNEFRERFAARLKRALAGAGVPEHGSGAYLQRLTSVTPKAASKWLNAESMPGTARIPAIAKDLGVRAEWLHYGDGDMRRSSVGDSAGDGIPAGAGRVSALVARRQKEDEARANELVMHHTKIVEDDAPPAPDEIEIPYFREVEMAAGGGRTQVIENHGHSMRFSLARLSRSGVQPESAACATVTGNSMEPVIVDGSPVGIDKSHRHITDGKIYALDHDGMLRVKRLYRLPLSRMRVVSENDVEYPEETYSMDSPDAPRIIGKVFWWETFD